MSCVFIAGTRPGRQRLRARALPPVMAEGGVPRFHFNVHDGQDRLDREGTELPSWEEARAEAIGLAGALLKDDRQRIALGEDWRMDVTDERGLILFRLDFTVLESPAIKKVWEADVKNKT